MVGPEMLRHRSEATLYNRTLGGLSGKHRCRGIRTTSAARGEETGSAHYSEAGGQLVSQACKQHIRGKVHDPNLSSGLTRDSVPSLHHCGRRVSLMDACRGEDRIIQAVLVHFHVWLPGKRRRLKVFGAEWKFFDLLSRKGSESPFQEKSVICPTQQVENGEPRKGRIDHEMLADKLRVEVNKLPEWRVTACRTLATTTRSQKFFETSRAWVLSTSVCQAVHHIVPLGG